MDISSYVRTTSDLSRDKYLQDVQTCKALGGLLKERIAEVFSSRREAEERFADVAGMTPATAKSTLVLYTSGSVVTEISSESQRTGRLYLDRLALFCEVLGVEQGDRILQLATTVNPSFEYPPRINYSIDAVLGIYKIRVKVSGKNVAVTPEQIRHLERLVAGFILGRRR